MNVYMIDDIPPRMCQLSIIISKLKQMNANMTFVNGNRYLANLHNICVDWGFGDDITPNNFVNYDDKLKAARKFLPDFIGNDKIIFDIIKDKNSLVLLDLKLNTIDFPKQDYAIVTESFLLELGVPLSIFDLFNCEQDLQNEIIVALKVLVLLKENLIEDNYNKILNWWVEFLTHNRFQGINYPLSTLILCASATLNGRVLLTTGYIYPELYDDIASKCPTYPVQDYALPSNYAISGIHNLAWLNKKLEEACETINYFFPNDRRYVSDLDVNEWKAMRKFGRDCSVEVYESDVAGSTLDKITWLRHLPSGNKLQVDTSQSFMNYFYKLRDSFYFYDSVFFRCPDYHWSTYEKENEIPSWDRPPIRALAQFAYPQDPNDITSICELFLDEIANYINDSNIKFLVDTNISELAVIGNSNLLWFNVSAMCRGLKGHLEAFCDLSFSDKDTVSRFNCEYDSAKIEWKFKSTSPECISLTISQYYIFNKTAHLLPLPSISAIGGKLKSEFYLYLIKSGASISESNGLIICNYYCENIKYNKLVSPIKEIVRT